MSKVVQHPKIFIGSSSEAREIALAMQHELRDVAQLEPWSQGMFRVGNVPLETLVRTLDGFDFAIFIFAPDDITKMRDKTSATVRDNVVFELGLFIGRLGPQRSFFVVPLNEELHLPTDLAGIIPAKYDSQDKNIQSAVSSACFEIRKIIKELGPLHHGRVLLYDGVKSNIQAHFKGVESRIYKDDQPTSEKGKGNLLIDGDGLLKIYRSNVDGKFEIQLRCQGPKKPSFQKRYNPPPRVLHVSCEARVEGGEHVLRFVLKDHETDKWLINEERTITSPDWTGLEVFLWVDSTRDFLFRIDDIASNAPSTVMIRNLLIWEENVVAG
jgi:hypothetical protein